MDMMLALDSSSTDNMMMIDEDYIGFMSDTLFSTIASQPYVFPDSREIGKEIVSSSLFLLFVLSNSIPMHQSGTYNNSISKFRVIMLNVLQYTFLICR